MTDQHRFKSHRVYCPAVGYHYDRGTGKWPDVDTGKWFATELEAEHFVFDLRRAGHNAWCEAA